MMENIKISKDELKSIRCLSDFDLVMILSKIHDHGWPMARRTLGYALEAEAARIARGEEKLTDTRGGIIWTTIKSGHS